MVLVRFASLALLVAAAAASPARAETADAPPPAPLTLVQPEALPFSDVELQRALLARLLPPAGEPGGPGPPRAEVAPAGEGAVTVHVGARSRVVALGNRSGADAARVVALVIAELLSAGAEADTAADAPAVVPSVAVAPSEPLPTIVATAPTPRPGSAWRLCMTAGAEKGTSDEELLTGTLDVDLVVPLGRGRLRLAPSAGLTVMPTRDAGTIYEVSFVSVAARVLGGASFGPVDVLGGPVVSPYSIGGAIPHAGVLFGAEAMARLTAPLSNQLRLVVATRLDAFADRVRIHWADGQVYATPRVGIGVGVGLAWDWTS